MRLPLVYHDDYSPPFPANHRFPMEKWCWPWPAAPPIRD